MSCINSCINHPQMIPNGRFESWCIMVYDWAYHIKHRFFRNLWNTIETHHCNRDIMRYITSSIIFGCIRPCGFCPHLWHLHDDKPMRFATLFGDKPMFIWQRNALASRSVKSRKLFYTIYTCSWTWLIIVYNTVYTHFCDYMYPQIYID